LAVAFDDVVMITLDNLDALPRALAERRCAALTGVPTRGGRLATVMSALRTRGPADLQVMVDLRGPAIGDLRRDGAPAMVGFAPVDRVELYGVPCLRLIPDGDPDALPDLHDVLAADLPAGQDVDALRAALDRAERAEARIRDLAEQVAAAQLPAPDGHDHGEHAHHGPGGVPMPWAAAGLLVAGSGAVLVLTSRDRRDAVLTAGVGALSLVQLWYARRAKRRLLDALAHPAPAAVPSVALASEELLAKVYAQQTEIHRNLAIVAAAVQDTAAAMVALAGEPPAPRKSQENK
jgi:hypothetical protein